MNVADDVTHRVPNQFHFVFGLKEQTEPFHICYYVCLESCRRVNRPEKIFFYYHYEPYGKYWDVIKPHLQLVPVDLNSFVSHFRYGFRNRRSKKYIYAHHSDFIRLEVLLENGGIYADIDTIFVNPVPQKLFARPFVLGREDDIIHENQSRRSLCNAFIISEKNSQFGRLWLERMNHSFDGSWSSHSTLLPQQLSEEHPELIHIEPSRTFYKCMWTREGLHSLLEGCDADNTDVVSMHLWSHLWWSKDRHDFSDFHGDLLTEDFIRNVDTTYNLAARKFLPNGLNKNE